MQPDGPHRYTTVADAVSIVVRGRFKPSIFGPAWFRGRELIREEEYLEHDLRSITRQVADFSLGTFDIYVSEDVLQVGTKNPNYAHRIQNLAYGTLLELPDTPLSALGINRSFHTGLPATEDTHRIGDALAPKKAWEGVLHRPGLRAQETWGVRDDGERGRVGVIVEPSDTVQPGLWININDHFELEPQAEGIDRDAAFLGQHVTSEPSPAKSARALAILGDDWESSTLRAQRIHDRIMQLAL